MSDSKKITVTGRCYCDKVRYKISTEKPIFSAYCHCTICQRITGGVATHAVGFQIPDLTITFGSDNLIPFNTTEPITRYRCKTCGTPIYGEVNEPDFQFRDISVATLDRDEEERMKLPEEFKPDHHMFYARRVVDIKDGLKKFARFRWDSEHIPE
ncbi:hypothetical protein HK097_011384 [Rhizophlyctis rosea]|uniref:CENP-V/GFA domain-containing protein n=1 Tax=Rhizophlyctis rosea TaxID=64517 RepID=A0AAD5SHQ3_9FUNG|nr:hypothetical protein HK097_011384 [Rhizophlyctis rosea]